MSVEILEETAGFGKEENSVLIEKCNGSGEKAGRRRGAPHGKTKSNERFHDLGIPTLVSFSHPLPPLVNVQQEQSFCSHFKWKKGNRLHEANYWC